MRYATLALLLLSITMNAARARPIGLWPYDQLLKEADLVVLAAAGASADAEDTPDNPWKQMSVGVNTTLDVKATLKGDRPAGKLVVLHYRLKELSPPNGPMLVDFRPGDYLLFLKRRADGRFEPAAGMTDPALSVRQVSAAPGR